MHNENTNEKEELKILKNLLRTTDNKRMHIRYQVKEITQMFIYQK